MDRKTEKQLYSGGDYCIWNPENSREESMKVVRAYINYYQQRSDLYKHAYFTLSVIKYGALAAIPVFEAVPGLNGHPWVVVAASSICILIDSMIHLFSMKEKWILYRRSNSKLMSEQRQYAANCGKYHALDEESRYDLFVQSVEKIYSSEALEWCETVSRAAPAQAMNSGHENS